MPLSFPILFVLTALVLGFMLLAVAALFAWRDVMRRIGGPFPDVRAAVLPEVSTLLDRVDARLCAEERQRGAEMEQLQVTLSQMRADYEWLAGERMIEQAIEMCRDGLSNERISSELGIPPASVRTLKLLRTH